MNTIKITITYLSPFSELFSKQSEKLEMETGTTLSELMDKLFYNYHKKFKGHKINRYIPYMIIILNGKVLPQKHLNIKLDNDDSIRLCMPFAGG